MRGMMGTRGIRVEMPEMGLGMRAIRVGVQVYKHLPGILQGFC